MKSSQYSPSKCKITHPENWRRILCKKIVKKQKCNPSKVLNFVFTHPWLAECLITPRDTFCFYNTYMTFKLNTMLYKFPSLKYSNK